MLIQKWTPENSTAPVRMRFALEDGTRRTSRSRRPQGPVLLVSKSVDHYLEFGIVKNSRKSDRIVPRYRRPFWLIYTINGPGGSVSGVHSIQAKLASLPSSCENLCQTIKSIESKNNVGILNWSNFFDKKGIAKMMLIGECWSFVSTVDQNEMITSCADKRI